MCLRGGTCMGGPQSAQPAAGNDPAGHGAQLILLAGPPSAAERALVRRWLRDGGIRPAAVLPLNGPGLARSLDQAVPETVVTAVRVAWLPRERGGERRVHWADVLAQANPRRPPVFWQNRIVRREPDRARMIVAEPATVAALRGRWGGTGSFARFVSRQARLALDRSERALLGQRYKVPKEVTDAIEDNPDFRTEVARLAGRLGLTEQEAMARAGADLDSMVASMSPVAVDLLSSTLRPLHAYAWDVQADTAGLDRLRALNREHALVFLPSHRSYADPLLLADVLAERPAGAAGRRRVHPAQLRRRRDLQAGPARVPRFPARQALQPRVVHGGRPFPDRKAAPAALRPAGLCGRGRRPGPGRGRLDRAGGDHLRPAPRGIGDGRRAGRRREEGRGPRLAGGLRAGPACPGRQCLRAVRRTALAARGPAAMRPRRRLCRPRPRRPALCYPRPRRPALC